MRRRSAQRALTRPPATPGDCHLAHGLRRGRRRRRGDVFWRRRRLCRGGACVQCSPLSAPGALIRSARSNLTWSSSPRRSCLWRLCSTRSLWHGCAAPRSSWTCSASRRVPAPSRRGHGDTAARLLRRLLLLMCICSRDFLLVFRCSPRTCCSISCRRRATFCACTPCSAPSRARMRGPACRSSTTACGCGLAP